MGNDLVYACSNNDTILMSWNKADSRHSTKVADITANGTIVTVNGLTTCTLTLEEGQVIHIPGSPITRLFNFK